MKWVSVCSGIGAPEVAWADLWGPPQWVSEIDPFPSAVLAHHFPGVPNVGDMTEIDDVGPADLMVGGTPCQSFSVAGKRRGLDDPRGNLALEFCRVAQLAHADWVVWENVPGVLSSRSDDGSYDFGSFLAALQQVGYQCAWRILDAQYFGVPQRRRRVFLVGHLGDWRRAAAVLLEPESMRGDPAPRREKAEGVAGTLGGSSQDGGFRTTDLDNNGALVINAEGGEGHPFLTAANLGKTLNNQTPLVCTSDGEVADPILSNQRNTWSNEGSNNFRLRNCIAFDETQITHPTNRSQPEEGGPSHAVAAGARPPAVALTSSRGYVRRLTPRECERLQGFPDDYTLIPWRRVSSGYQDKARADTTGEFAEIDGEMWALAPDGHRYKALGNSMAVPVMRWIGQRIQLMEEIT